MLLLSVSREWLLEHCESATGTVIVSSAELCGGAHASRHDSVGCRVRHLFECACVCALRVNRQGRVAASMVHSVGLQSFVTYSMQVRSRYLHANVLAVAPPNVSVIIVGAGVRVVAGAPGDTPEGPGAAAGAPAGSTVGADDHDMSVYADGIQCVCVDE